MPILDAKTVFARNANISAGSGATILATGSTVWTGAIVDGGVQVVDQEKAGDAVGQELTVKVVVGDTAISGTSATTAQFKLQTGGANAVTSGGSAVTSNFKDLLMTGPIAVNGAKTGTVLACFRIPEGTERYLRVIGVIGGAACSAGTVSIYATRDL